jgi:hypothetical protein
LAGSTPRRSDQLAIRACRHPGVVAGGHRVEAQLIGPRQQPVELQVPVALDAGIRRAPSAWSDTYGSTTWRSNSSEKLKTWWAIPSCWATRRASSTSATEQHPVSDGPPHSFMVAPTTSSPASTNRAAATDESTPPDMATSTRTGQTPRNRATAAGTATAARSISAAVVDGPRRQPEAGEGLVLGDTHGKQDRAGFHGAAGARRPCRSAHPGLIEQDQQSFALDPGKTQVQVAGRARYPRGSLDRIRHGRPEAAGQLIAQSPHPGGGGRPLGSGNQSGRGQADDPGHIVRSAAKFALLSSSVEDGPQRRSPAPGQGAATLRAAYLVATDTDEIGICSGNSHVEPAGGLYGVGMQKGARSEPPNRAGEPLERLDHARLMVGQLHRHQSHARIQQESKGVQIDQAVGVHRRHPNLLTARQRRLDHGRVLDCADDERAGTGGQ